jgi:hypothetical protein
MSESEPFDQKCTTEMSYCVELRRNTTAVNPYPFHNLWIFTYHLIRIKNKSQKEIYI